MASGPFSSLPQRERFQAYLTVVLIVVAILVFAVIAGITIYEKIQASEANAAAKQSSGVTTAPLNDGNALNPPSIWNAQSNSAPTNATTPLPEPAALDTNAN